jgi:dienelactone hydrolase
MRVRGPAIDYAVVCVNGGGAAAVDGTWSASVEWLVDRLAPRFPQIRFAEVRYRIKSWNHFDSCVLDARAALAELDTQRIMLLGFSMGGAVAISVADDPRVSRVIGLAPWIPDQLALEPLRGKRLDVLHGSLDRSLPGVPGVSPASSQRGFARAQAFAVPGTYTLIRGASHAIALRAGRPFPMPRAGTWARLVSAHLEDFVRAR